MASPTIYKWTDASAPTITRGSASEYKNLFQKVLVDGYGAKAAAGWTIPYSDTTSFILQQGGTESVKAGIKLQSFSTSNCYAVMDAAVSWSALSTPVNQFAGDTVNHRVGIGFATSSTYQIPWVIFATARSMYCFFGYNNTGVRSNNFTDSYSHVSGIRNYHWFFGDYKKYATSFDYNQAVIATELSTTGDNLSYARALTYNSNESYSYKSCPGIDGGSLGEHIAKFWVLKSNSYSATYDIGDPDVDNNEIPIHPNIAEGSQYLDKVRIGAARSILGEMPGLYYVPGGTNVVYRNRLWTETPSSGTYSGVTFYIMGTEGGQIWVATNDWGVN